MGNAAKGYSGATLEPSTLLGKQQLLNATAISALPASLSTAISALATTGMHLCIRVYNHTATGTITVTGTAPGSLAVVAETTTTLPTNETPGGYVDYTTASIFGAVNASGVTLGGGLTNGTVVIYGIVAAKKMIVGEFKMNDKRKEKIITTQRGTFALEHQPTTPLADAPDWDYTGDFYPDNNYWIAQSGIWASPTTTNLPDPGIAVLGSTSVTSSSNASAAIQPTAPGMILQIVLAGPSTAATVSVTGTNVAGETITEVIVPSTKTAGTFTSTNVFKTIAASGIVWGAFGAGTITVTGYFGFKQSAVLGDTLSTFSVYQYDSTGNYIMPFCFTDEWAFEGGLDKETKITAKGMGQDFLYLGDVTSTAQQGPTFGQPVDEVITGWKSLIFIDALTGTAGTTLNADVTDYKVSCTLKQKPIYTDAFNPPSRVYTRVYRNRREIKLELTCDMTIATYQNEVITGFKRGTRRLVQIQLIGPYMGTVASVAYYLGIQVTVPVRWDTDPQRVFTISQENVTVKLQGTAFWSNNLNYDMLVTWFTHNPSW